MLRSWNLNLRLKRDSTLSVYLQIAQQIIDEIKRGRLLPSTIMPGTRELADTLKVNRKTVRLAYDELIAQGWLTTEQRRGTFVSAELPSFVPREHANIQVTPTHAPEFNAYARHLAPEEDGALDQHIDFNDGIPDTRLIPFEMLSRAFRHALVDSSRANRLGYDDPRGMLILRQAIAAMLNMERGLSIGIENTCIVRGSQMGIFLAARILTRPGDCVVVENLTYPPAREAFRSCGATILSVGLDEHGLDVGALEKLCQQHRVRAIYVTPHHQFPTTVMMTAERRLKLLMLAEQYDFVIVEDDYDHEFHFHHHPVFPLASDDASGRVVYVGSLSKVLAPGLRVGYLVAAKTFIDQCLSEVMLIDRQGNSVTELAVSELMESGEIRRHIRRTLKTYNERRNILIELVRDELGEFVTFEPPVGGLALWLSFNEGINMDALAKTALTEGVRVLPGSTFSDEQNVINGIRLGFGSLNPGELTVGIQRLKRAIQRQTSP